MQGIFGCPGAFDARSSIIERCTMKHGVAQHTAALIVLAAASVLGVAACGGRGAPPAAPAASHTTSSSPPVHLVQPGGPALIVVPGYDFIDIPGGGPNAKDLIKSDPQHLKSASAQMVLHNGNTIASLVLVQVKPRYANIPRIQQGMVSAFLTDMAGSDATVTTETIHTEKVAIARQGSTVVYCWYHNGAVTVVTGDNGSAIHDFVGAYLQATHG
jgi:hypothetical protein